VESKRGRGTTFFIYLLAADKRKKRNKNQIPGGWKNA
jgi:hypothetical protein